jgi:hypothetical protein
MGEGVQGTARWTNRFVILASWFLIVASVIFVTLLTATSARSAPSATEAALPIPGSIAAKVCPYITQLVRSVGGQTKIVFRRKSIRAREVHCFYLYKGRHILDVRVIRVRRCLWEMRFTLNGLHLSTERGRIWCV